MDTPQVRSCRPCCDFSPLSGHVPPAKCLERYLPALGEVYKDLGDVLGVPLGLFWRADAG